MPSIASKLSSEVLSIRLSPGGLSFWTGTRRERFVPLRRGVALRAAVSECLKRIGGRGDFRHVRLFMDTPTVLVPSEVFVSGRAGDYLTINNLSGDETVFADAGAGVVAVMACGGEELEVFRGIFGPRLEVRSAFELALERGATTIYLAGERAYVAVWRGGGLVFCDSLPYSAAADLVYYAAQLLLPGSHIYIKGLGARAASQALGKKFRLRCV